jgi:hypothetical protein
VKKKVFIEVKADFSSQTIGGDKIVEPHNYSGSSEKVNKKDMA